MTPPVRAYPFLLTASITRSSSAWEPSYVTTWSTGANTSSSRRLRPATGSEPGCGLRSYTLGWNRAPSSSPIVRASILAPPDSSASQCALALSAAISEMSGPTSVERSKLFLETRMADRPPWIILVSSFLHPLSTTRILADEHLCPADWAKDASTASHTCSGSADESATRTLRPPVSATSLASGALFSTELSASAWLILAAVRVEPTKDTPANSPDDTSAAPASD
mmetsp:Transcript_94/g.443  ORF Transcript_94/g.443 Transcript_94/m.443 type:complete len:225 (+) Transcript_94:497-1171(+)